MSEGMPILIVEDLPTDAELCEREINKALPESRFLRVETREAFLAALADFRPALIISDYKMPRFDGMAALQLALELAPETPFIVLTGSMNEETAVECMKAGAWDYVIKEHIRRLGPAVLSALDRKQVRQERRTAEAALIESERLYRNLFENHTAVKLLIDPESGRLIDANLAAAEYYGWPRERLRAMRIQQINTLSPEEIRQEMGKVRERKRGHFEFRHRRADGSVRDVAVFSSRIDHRGQVLFHSIVHDITDRKQAETALLTTMEGLRRALAGTVRTISLAVEVRDPYTAGHQRRTADLAQAIAAEMGLPEDGIDFIRMAAAIHDIGKIAVPAEILSKPTKLTELEFKLIQVHAEAGYNILKEIEFPWPVAEVVRQHHERLDGTGYPRQIGAGEILPEANIIAVADVVEAMASFRPYRPALGIDAALAEISGHRGGRYDAPAVDACLRLFRERNFQLT